MPARPRRLSLNLVLIGGRGAGKTSIARRLLQLEPRFLLLSLDTLIQYEAKSTIPDLVAQRGWRRFRELEYETARKAGGFRGALIDAGGGVVVDLDRRGREIYSRRKVRALRRNSLILYLRRDVDYLMSRIENDPDRPALSKRRSFEELMERREPWYWQAADCVLDCKEKGKDKLAAEILRWYYKQLGKRKR